MQIEDKIVFGSYEWRVLDIQNSVKALYIFGTDGNIGIHGNNIHKGNISDGRCTGGVRPALWIKL